MTMTRRKALIVLSLLAGGTLVKAVRAIAGKTDPATKQIPGSKADSARPRYVRTGGQLPPEGQTQSDQGPIEQYRVSKSPFHDTTRDIVEAVSERLLPGAIDAGVPQYIDYWMTTDNFQAARRFIEHGSRILDRHTKLRFKKIFVECNEAQQDEMLQAFAEREIPERRFDTRMYIQQMMELVCEGYLSDPKYGGNRNRVGWNYIGMPDGLRSCWWSPDGVKNILDPEWGFND